MQASPGPGGRLPRRSSASPAATPFWWHHDGDGKADGAAGDCLQGQARSPVFRPRHRRQQPLVIYERDQVPDHQVRDHGVVF
jgi:hypothetical protein